MLIILIALAVWFLGRAKPETNTNSVSVNNNVNVVVINLANTQSNTNVNTATDSLVEARRLANLFVERYGSYSTETQHQNIIDLKKFMTKKMQTESDALIAASTKNQTNTTYNAVTAKAVTTSILNQIDTAISFRITTIRTSDTGLTNGQKTYNQDIIIRLLKQDSVWLVDSAFWQ